MSRRNNYKNFQNTYSEKKANEPSPSPYKNQAKLVSEIPEKVIETEEEKALIPEFLAEDLRQVFQDNTEKLIGVYIYSDKCQPCKKVFEPDIKQFMKNINNQMFMLIKLNCVKNVNFCKSLKIDAVPIVIFFKDGKIIDIPGKESRHTGSCIKNFQQCLGDIAEYLNM
jgi:thioredoxin-like negative regulator of GroEL